MSFGNRIYRMKKRETTIPSTLESSFSSIQTLLFRNGYDLTLKYTYITDCWESVEAWSWKVHFFKFPNLIKLIASLICFNKFLFFGKKSGRLRIQPKTLKIAHTHPRTHTQAHARLRKTSWLTELKLTAIARPAHPSRCYNNNSSAGPSNQLI